MLEGQKKRQLFFIVTISIIVCFVYKYLLPYVLPFIFAYWFTLLVSPAIDFLSKRLRFPGCVSTFFVLTAFFSVLGAGLFFLFRTLFLQLDALLKNFPIYQQMLTGALNSMCDFCDHYFKLQEGASFQFIASNMNRIEHAIQTNFVPQMTEQALAALKKAAAFISCFFIIILSSYLILKDKKYLEQAYKNNIFYKEIHTICGKLSSFFLAYFRMQLIVTSIIAIGCTICFFLTKSNYALLLGIFVAVFDAFPILGSGVILLPIAFFRFLAGDFFAAALFVTTYGFCQIVRQTMEPKLLGNQIGIPPIFTVMSIVIGLKIYGLIGIFLGPITYVTITSILTEYNMIRPSPYKNTKP